MSDESSILNKYAIENAKAGIRITGKIAGDYIVQNHII